MRWQKADDSQTAGLETRQLPQLRLQMRFIPMDSWASEFGGNSIAGYRKYVESELGDFQDNPLEAALQGWVLGSAKFLQSLVSQVNTSGRSQH